MPLTLQELMRVLLIGATVAVVAACSEAPDPGPSTSSTIPSSSPTPSVRVPLSFSVFEADRMWPLMAGGALTTTDVDAMATITNDTSGNPRDARKLRLKSVAPAMHARRALFDKPALDDDDIAAAIELSTVVAKASGVASLEIKTHDAAAARAGLDALSAWFAAAQRDDQVMPYLLPTMDDGPFYGTRASLTKPENARETSRVVLPGDAGTVVVWTPDDSARGVFTIELLARDGETTFKRWDLKEPRSLRTLTLHQDDMRALPGYGAIVVASADWSGGREAGFFHFSEKGDLRFFFLSW